MERGQPALHDAAVDVDALSGLLGESAAIAALRAKVRRLLGGRGEGRLLPPVLLEGETGTGKGLLARLLHRAGPRQRGPFIDVNCAAIPLTLLEAEMFGFERGAFTDARQAKPGLFQLAHGGTIFLDEVGLLPEPLQAKLLKVLEERAVRRLGALRAEPVDAWVLAATNEDLRQAVQERRFRDDLYHRLAVITLTLPALRERSTDVIGLAEHFLEVACADYGLPAKTLGADARAALRAYPWPGNVRELANVIERTVLLSDGTVVTAAALALPAARSVAAPVAGASLDDIMREHLRQVLGQTGWNISRAASLLQVTRNTVRARIEKYGLTREDASTRAAAPGGGRAARVAPQTAVVPAVRWESCRVAFLRTRVRGAEGTERALTRALEMVSDKVRSFGGRVSARSPNGVLAVFGLTPAEDPASIAAHAALAMEKTADRGRREETWPLALTSAIHCTQVLVGVGETETQLDMESSREAVHAVEALAESGDPGAIIVSTAAAPFVRRRFELAPLAAPPARFGLVGLARAAGPGGRTVFVGRRYELEFLQRLLQVAAQTGGQLVGIAGEAGLGKSRLLWELKRSLTGELATIIEAHGLPFAEAVPFFTAAQLVRQVCGIDEVDLPSAISDKLGAALAGHGIDPAGSRDLAGMLDLGGERESGAHVDRRSSFDVAGQLLVRQSRRAPLVILVEDCHCMDSTSSDFLASLVEILPSARILLVLTYRPGYRLPGLEHSYVTQLALAPLSPADSRAILAETPDHERWPRELTERLIARADGNPFFLEELTRVVTEQGPPGSDGVVDVPETVEAVLGARLARLTPDARELLLTASVIGNKVPLRLLAAVMGRDPGTLKETLSQLHTADFIVATEFGDGAEYDFRHALTHDVAYASVPADRRRVLHGRILDVMEAAHARPLAEQAGALAQHARRAERWEKAVEYFRKAGSTAAGRAGYREAVVCFEHARAALAHLPPAPTALALGVDVRFDLRNAHWSLGQLARGLACLREAEPLAEKLGDQRRLARLAAHTSSNALVLGDNARALAAGERALAIATGLRDVSLQVDARLFLGVLHTSLGNYRRAVAVLEANVGDLLGERGDGWFGEFYGVHTRTWLTWALAELGAFEAAAAQANDALQVAERRSHPHTMVAAAWARGLLDVERGEPRTAVAALERALTLAQSAGVALWRRPATALLGRAYALAGRMDDALPLLEQAVGADENSVALAAWETYRAEAYMLAGRLDEAVEVAGHAVALARTQNEAGFTAHALRLLGDLSTRCGRADEGEASYREALALAEPRDMRPLVDRCRAALATLPTTDPARR